MKLKIYKNSTLGTVIIVSIILQYITVFIYFINVHFRANFNANIQLQKSYEVILNQHF